MVQRKLGIKASSSSLKAEKKPSTSMRPSIQNHDTKSKGAELSKKMKKSRSFKRSSDLESLKKHSMMRNQLCEKPNKLSPCTPVKQSPPKVGGAVSSPPNYMKSTSSSEARKEQKQVPIKTPSKSMIGSTSRKLFSASASSSSSSSAVASHKLSSRSLNRTSSLKKVRTLTKAPTFKPSRSTISVNKCSKVALCENLDVKRATCSSTMKDSKFPQYLDLNPGGTEYQGTSVMKVCPYNYCSLNGHRHNTAPPLKSFLSARRRIMKAQRSMKPVAAAPYKEKPCKDDGEGKGEVGADLVVVNKSDNLVPLSFNEEKSDFFIEVYVKESEDKSESMSVDQEKESAFTDMNFGKDCSKDFDWESSSSITLDELFAELSDMEWEEDGRTYLTGLEMEHGISTPSDQESDHTFELPSGNEILCLVDEESFKKDDANIEFLKEFLAEESVEFFQDEITDCHEQFSDSESSICDGCPGDCEEILVPSAANEDIAEESSASDKEVTEASATEDDIIKDSSLSDHQTISSLKERLIDEEEEVFGDAISNHLPAAEAFSFCHDDAANGFDDTSGETAEEQPHSLKVSEAAPLIDMEKSEYARRVSLDSEEGGNSILKKLSPTGNITQTVEETEAEELAESVSEEEQPNVENKTSGNVDSRKFFKKESSFNHELSNSCNNLNITKGRRKQGEESEELKSFNPREPNYLEVEPDPDAEKVDLRHQEMDKRRDSEEWMLDYALRKAVNQLAPARKRKVALLVEAFEKVIPPAHNCETRVGSISSCFARIQPCN